MTLILKQLFSFIQLLNSDTGTNQLAAGFCCGFILGMTPTLSLQSLLVFAVLFFFRIQMGAAFVTAFFFAFLAFLLDPVFDAVGGYVLEIQALEGVYTSLYNMPIIPFTRFNNTIVMGSGVITILLAPLVFIVSKKLIIKYRQTVVEKFKQSKFFKALKATSFYKWYAKYEEYYGY